MSPKTTVLGVSLATLLSSVLVATGVVCLPEAHADSDRDLRGIRRTVESGAIREQIDSHKDQRLWRSRWDGLGHMMSPPVELHDESRTFGSQSGDAIGYHVTYVTGIDGTIKDKVIHTAATGTIDPRTGQLPLQMSASANTVELSWWDPSHQNVHWTVARNGVPLTTTIDSFFADTKFSRTENATYSITGTGNLGKSSIQAGSDQATEFYYEIDVPAFDKSTIGRNIDDEEIAEKSMHRDVAPTEMTIAEVVYGAFIKDEYIPTPDLCGAATSGNAAYFNGNNRSWDDAAGAPKPSKAMGRVGIAWDGTNPTRNVAASTGETIAYDANKKEIKRAKEPEDSISVSGPAPTAGNPVTTTVNFDSGNPLCKLLNVVDAPKINASLIVWIDQAGNIRLNGSHDQAPHHEVTYLYNGSKGAGHGCAYRREITDFEHLAPPFPNATIDANKSIGHNGFGGCSVST